MKIIGITSVMLLGIVISSTPSDITITQNTTHAFVKMSESIGVCKALCEENSTAPSVHQCQCHMCDVNEAVNGVDCTRGYGKRGVLRFAKWLTTDQDKERTERQDPLLTTILCRDIWVCPDHIQATCETLNNGDTVLTRKYGVRTQCVFTTKQDADDGSTILHSACSRGKIEMVDHILNMSIPNIDLERKDHRGWTPLFAAVGNDEVDTVEHLIQRGSKVSAKSYTGDTVLHIASHKASLEMVEYLVQFDAIEISSKNDAGDTVLMMVMKRNDDLLVEPIKDILEEKTRT